MAKLELDAKIELKGLFLRDPNKAISIFEEEFGKALDEASSMFLRKVNKYTPRYTGTFAGSLFREKRGQGFGIHAIIGTPLQIQGRRLEYGEPYSPDFRALVEWVRFKFGVSLSESFALAKVIKRNISRRGMVNVARMFKRGFEEGKGLAQGILDKAAKKIMERWK